MIRSLLDTQLCRPMTDNESTLFVWLASIETDAAIDLTKPDFGLIIRSNCLRIMLSRVPPATRLSLALAIWLSSISDRPGVAVMWAHTVHRLWKQSGQTVTIATWAAAFPNGVPTAEGYEEIWDAQKIGQDNALDIDATAWMA